MTQRLHDVTGDPIRLSAHQRELQREGMILMLNMQTRQINTLTEAMRGLQARIELCERQINCQADRRLRPWWRRWLRSI